MARSMRGWTVALLGLLAASLAAGPAHAQSADVGCQEPILTLAQQPPRVTPGHAYNLLYAVENANGPRIEAVRATVTTTAPAGWSAIPAQRDFTLGPRDVAFDVLAITAPNRGAGEASGNITLAVTFVCTSGAVQTSASTSTTIPVRIESFQAPWPIVLTGFLILAAGVTVLGVRRLRRGVALVPLQAERTLEPGKSAKLTLTVENRRGKPQSLAFRALGVPPDWGIHLALSQVDLEPGEEKTLWAIVRAPPTAEHGLVLPITLVLEAAAPARDVATADVRLHVEDPERMEPPTASPS